MKSLIYPAFWLDGNAQEAANFYCSIFGSSEVKSSSEQAVLFESHNQKFLCIDGGPAFKPNPSISTFVLYEDKQELDKAWAQLIQDGKVLMPLDSYDWSPRYGWVQDKYHISWQLHLGKAEDTGVKFSTSLLFTGTQNGRAQEAINHYTKIFKPSSVVGILHYGPNDGDTEGHIAHAQFNLVGSVLMAMDSSQPHQFGFNEGISLVVECDSQEEIDQYWDKLSAVPEAEQCGWLKDKFGVSWQIIPSELHDMMNNRAKAKKVAEAFLQMKKFDLKKLREAYTA